MVKTGGGITQAIGDQEVAIKQKADGTLYIEVTALTSCYTISSDKDTHFTGAIAQNAVEKENITGLKSDKITITKIAIQAKENLDFDVMFFGKDTFEDTDLDVDAFQAFERLDIPTDGIRIGAANQYYLDVSGLNIDYEDEDGTKELHVALRCRSAAGKSAGAAGEVKLTITYIPRV